MSVVRTRHSGQVEVRSGPFPDTPIPAPWAGYYTASGEPVTTAAASGLPAVGRAIRLVGGLIGMAMIGVFEGRAGNKREVEDSPQAALFRAPYPGVADYDWRFDIAVSLEVSENAFIRKIKTGRGKLVALQVLQPKYVSARLDRNGEKYYEVSTADGWKRVETREILHIRGQTVDGGPFGVSRIQQHRDPLGSMLAAQTFEGSYFRNSARPDLAVSFPQGVTIEQAKEWESQWTAKHGGPRNVGKPIAVGGGATISTIPINMRDAQFIEARGMSIGDVARIMDVEEVLLGTSQAEQQDDQAMDRFLAFQLPPRLARISRALKADEDLFPLGSPLYPEFIAEPLLFASPTTRANVQHSQIQAGTLLPDEARADNGRPPLPDGLGQIPLVTPVGGAPNPSPLPNDPQADQTPARELVVVNMPPDDKGAKEIRDGMREMAAGFREQKPPIVNIKPPTVNVDAPVTVNVPEQQPADVTVNVDVPEQAAPVVNVAAAEVRIPAQPDVIVNVPEQAAADVRVENVVNVPEQRQPDVQVDVHVPEQEAPVVNVETAAPEINVRAAEQAAPNVTVNVDPTPVTVENTVNVPEAPPPIVMVENTLETPPRKISLERDSKGNLKGARVDDA